jgi:lipoate-protein ligase A
MRYLIDNRNSSDPGINLALEEYCLKNLDTRHAFVLFYVNAPSVIVGRNQNILQEIDERYVDAQCIPVMRRLSGGGAVYHDSGNLNFSFIQGYRGGLPDIQTVLRPVLCALHLMGVGAHINDRNDVLVGTKKISGSARFSNTRRGMIHGTLLFDADLRALRRALHPPANRLLTKAVRSVPHPVTNIRPLLDHPMDLDGFTQRLLALLRRQIGATQKLSLDERTWKRIHQLAADKYRSWDWTFGRTPDFSVIRNGRDKNRLRVDVHRGKIAKIADLDPDNGAGIGPALEKRLLGTRYERKDILRVLDGMRIAVGSRVMDTKQLTQAISYR